MEIPAQFAAEQAILQQNVALAVLKASADADKAIANILEQSLTVGPSSRGGNVNFSA
jgi:hypothetical protein